MIISLILSFFLINISSVFLLVSVLFIFLLLGKTSSQPKQLSVSSWVILDFKGLIDVILPTQLGTSSLVMSLSLRVPLSSPLKSIPMFQMSYMSLCLTTSRFPLSTYGCCDSTTSSLYSSSSSSNKASC